MLKKQRPKTVVAPLLLAMLSIGSVAQERFPRQPIRMLVGFGAGGSVDIGARALAEAASKHLGQPVMVDNVTGAGGGVALGDLARKPSDGHTVAVTTSSYAAITAQLQKPTFDLTAFETLLGVGEFRHVIVAQSGASFRRLSDIAAAPSPNAVRFSHLGTGTSLHIQGYLAFRALGVEPIQVPYRGAPELITAIVGGHSDIGIADISAVDALLRAGTLQLVAVNTRDRLKEYPDVPTLAEQGVDNVDVLNPLLGVVVRKEVPAERKAKLRDAFRQAAQSQEFAAAAASARMQIRALQPQDFDALSQQASRAALPVIEEIRRNAQSTARLTGFQERR